MQGIKSYPGSFKRRTFALLSAEWEKLAMTLALAGVSVALAVWANASRTPSANALVGHGAPVSAYLGTIAVLFFLYAVGAIVAIWKDATKKIYDITVALKYNDIFYYQMAEDRAEANALLVEMMEDKGEWAQVSDFDRVDDVLDVLDDIGFLVQGRQMSDIVAYHYFFYLTQLYYEACAAYIEFRQKGDEKSQHKRGLPAQWEHIKPLYLTLRAIEAHKNDEKDEKTLAFSPAELLAELKKELPEPEPEEERKPKKTTKKHSPHPPPK